MRILVTGNCGFIGQNFVRMYKNDHKITGVDKMGYAADPGARSLCPTWTEDISNANLDHLFQNNKFKAIVNFAAESHVDNSIASPKPFMHSNFMGTFAMLELARKYNVKKFIQISCFDENTRVMTKRGFLSYDEIKIGDIVFSVNPETGHLEEKPVEKVIVQNYTGRMIHFKTKTVDLKVTKNHNVFYQEKDKDGSLSKIKKGAAENIVSKHNLYLPRYYWEKNCKNQTYVDGIGDVDTNHLFYMCGMFIGNGFTALQTREVENKTGLKRNAEYYKKTRDSKTGRFIKTGKIGNIKTSTCHSWRIWFDIPENDKGRKRLEKVLTALNINWHAHNNKSGEHIYFTSKEWVIFFDKNFGKGFFNKTIPDWILEYDSEHLKHLFDGLIDSDGHYGSTTSLSTSSPHLVVKSCELGLKLGFFPRIHERPDVLTYYKCEDRFINSTTKGYDIYFRTQNIGIGQKTSRNVPYVGKIWCVKVKNNKNMIVERNGWLQISGNTDEVYGDLGLNDPPFSNLHELKPSSPYSASKAAADMLALAYHRTYDLNVVITRSCNNYGPHQHVEKFVPVIINSALNNSQIPLYGDGTNMREWIHVEDNCRGIMAALTYGKPGGIYNLGSGIETSNIDMIKCILKIMGKPESLISYVEDRKGHDKRYFLDSQHTYNDLKWKASIGLDDGLEKTIEWVEENSNYLGDQ